MKVEPEISDEQRQAIEVYIRERDRMRSALLEIVALPRLWRCATDAANEAVLIAKKALEPEPPTLK